MNVHIAAGITVIAIVFTLLIDVPENVPIDQLCRLTISESSANVTIKSVMAEHMYPIVTPHTTSIDILCIFLEISSMNPRESIEPIKEAVIIMNEPVLLKKLIDAINAIDTTSFAPDEIPSTNGPAIGLWKRVWRRYPDKANAPPKSIDANALGIRIFIRIFDTVVFSVPEKIAFNASFTGISALPINIFIANDRISSNIKAENIIGNLMQFFFNFNSPLTYIKTEADFH